MCLYVTGIDCTSVGKELTSSSSNEAVEKMAKLDVKEF